MEYSKIDWDADFVWTTVVVTSEDSPVNAVLFNRLMPELRAQVLSYLSWTDEMSAFEHTWGLVHPWHELGVLYGVKPGDPGWL